ncbi:MAG: hypothetical protein ABSH06_25090 [Thermodesulfobacteriota bacterium]|jgi:hypothetical protein
MAKMGEEVNPFCLEVIKVIEAYKRVLTFSFKCAHNEIGVGKKHAFSVDQNQPCWSFFLVEPALKKHVPTPQILGPAFFAFKA